MKTNLPPVKGLAQEELNRQVVEQLAKIVRAVTALEERLTAAGIP
jgi:hypothetical protein